MDPAIYLFLTLLAAAFLVWHAVALWNAQRSAAWPRVPGQVLRAEAEASGLATGDYPWDRPLLVARVRYEYEVGGRMYRNDRVRFGGAGLKEAVEARAHAARYAPGAAILVAYDPRDPYNAVLEPGTDAAHYGWTACATVLLALTASLYAGLLTFAG